MTKKCLVFMLLLMVLFSFQAVSAADYTQEADMLNSLGLFNGTQNGYELERVPTRVEAAAMLVRLLGAVDEANEMKYEHPFTDVPEWADNIAGYLYEKGLTKGVGNNLFGSNQTTIARDYTTFMLRSLGYDSSSDFNYLEALSYAESKGILTAEEAKIFNSQDFKRNEMVLLSYKTLNAQLNGSKDLLVDKLFENGAINKAKAFEIGVTDSFETVITNMDSSLDKLEVYSTVINIYAEKKEVKSGKISGFDIERQENFIEGYGGGISFKKGIDKWKGLNIRYQISFYNEGKFIKEINYLHNYREGIDDSGTEFITPIDKFDEIKIIAKPMSNDEINKDIEGKFDIITTKDVNYLKDTILKYGNVHATSHGDSRDDFNSPEIINAYVWKTIFSRVSLYDDGSVFKPFANKNLVDGNFSIEFTDEGSFIGTEGTKRIIGLPKNDDINGQINFILIYGEGFKTERIFLVK